MGKQKRQISLEIQIRAKRDNRNTEIREQRYTLKVKEKKKERENNKIMGKWILQSSKNSKCTEVVTSEVKYSARLQSKYAA